MTKSEQIRTLAAQGLSVSEVAKRVGVRYQHAYKVLNDDKRRTSVVSSQKPDKIVEVSSREKPVLTTELLIAGGFRHVSSWILSSEDLVLESPVPHEVGVYAFVKGGVAQYVGVATMGLKKRLYFYGRPGISQRTSQRLNAKIKLELTGTEPIEIYVAMPPNLEWNGLPVHGSAGLELGLIKTYSLPWNMRSAGN